MNIVVLPVLFEGEVKAVIELASFHRFSDIHLTFLDQLTESIGIVLNTIVATMRTEELLKQSQSLAAELQTPAARAHGHEHAAGAAGAHAADVRGAPQAAAGGAAADQRGARGEGGAARPSRTARSRARTTRSTWRAPRSRRRPSSSRSPRSTSPSSSPTCRTSCGRRSTACSSCRSCCRENPDGNLSEKQVEFAKTIYSSGSRPARADQRDPRPVEDRVGHDGRGREAGAVRRAAGVRGPHVPAARRGQGPRLRRAPGRRPAADDRHRCASACSRCSRTCCRTRSSSPSRARWTSRSGVATEGWSRGHRDPGAGAAA